MRTAMVSAIVSSPICGARWRSRVHEASNDGVCSPHDLFERWKHRRQRNRRPHLPRDRVRRTFTAAGFGNWFRGRCDEAGLKGLSAHGMRKAAATRAAERGATAFQLMAIFCWRNIKQAEVYVRAAERKRLAGAAMHLLRTNSGQESLAFNPQTPVVREKGAKS